MGVSQPTAHSVGMSTKAVSGLGASIPTSLTSGIGNGAADFCSTMSRTPRTTTTKLSPIHLISPGRPAIGTNCVCNTLTRRTTLLPGCSLTTPFICNGPGSSAHIRMAGKHANTLKRKQSYENKIPSLSHGGSDCCRLTDHIFGSGGQGACGHDFDG